MAKVARQTEPPLVCALADCCDAIAAAEASDEALRAALARVLELTGLRCASVWVRGCGGTPAPIASAGRCAVCSAAERARTAEWMDCVLRIGGPPMPQRLPHGARSVLAMPILNGQERAGVLVLTAGDERLREEPWTAFAHTLALQLALTLAARRSPWTARISDAQLRQLQKMEAMGQLTGGVAHDFNNVLAVVVAEASLVLEQLRKDDPLRADVAEIKAAADRGTQLTRQLLAFSRKQTPVLQPVCLNLCVETLRKMLKRLLGSDVELCVSPGERLGFIRGDVGQLEQVLINLAVNARDAMAEGGTLSIATENATLDGGRYVVLSVSDTGCGMDAATQARIFEPFFTTKEQGKGTGLGLATVDGIVRQAGGFVRVTSAPGAGATFRIYFPRID